MGGKGGTEREGRAGEGWTVEGGRVGEGGTVEGGAGVGGEGETIYCEERM